MTREVIIKLPVVIIVEQARLDKDIGLDTPQT